jgi:DedD protein
MRFEIGPGGGFVILVGLAGLSAAVFFLGMISGREMAETELSQNQLATVYPMPPAAPAAALSPPAVDSGAVSPQPPPRLAGAESTPAPLRAAAIPPAAPAVAPHPAPRVAPPAIAAAAPPHRAPPAASPPPEEEGEGAEEPSAPSAEAGVGGGREESGAYARRRGYNIVIDAAMDRAGADRMISRLLALGYTPHLVQTEINGQTWYKLQIGPYPTQDDARAAQEQLRDAYTAHYIRHSVPTHSVANPAPAGGDSDTAAPPAEGSDSGSD